MMERIVVGVSGMPGAGKGIVRDCAKKMGCHVLVMGDEIREEAKRRKIKQTPENLGMIMLKLRDEEGPAAVAKRCIPKMEKAKEDVIFVEGIRSQSEVDEFKKHFHNFILIAIYASPETRFRRLFQRRRNDDPESWKTFMKRDLREIGVGIGSVIATADYMIVNEGRKSQFRREILRILKEALGKWMR